MPDDDLPTLPWDLIRDKMDDHIQWRMFEVLTAAVPTATTNKITVTTPGGAIPAWKIRELLLGLAPEEVPVHDPELLEKWLES